MVVVGGGAAGLSGALALAGPGARCWWSTPARPRNAPAGHVHNYLGREGTPPVELLAIGRAEVAGYGGEVVDGRVTGGSGSTTAFRVALADGAPVAARRLLVTTGLVDELPDVAGLAERWGRDVLHCPYCHGWEVRDQRIAVLANNAMATHLHAAVAPVVAAVTLVTHPDHPITPEQADRLGAVGIDVVDGPAAEALVDGDRLVGPAPRRRCRAGVRCRGGPGPVAARAEALEPLGLTPSEFVMAGESVGTYVAADPTGKTEVPGVWVAGNVASPADTVIVAAGAALRTAGMINLDLIEEDADAAVAARAGSLSR